MDDVFKFDVKLSSITSDCFHFPILSRGVYLTFWEDGPQSNVWGLADRSPMRCWKQLKRARGEMQTTQIIIVLSGPNHIILYNSARIFQISGCIGVYDGEQLRIIMGEP